MATTGFVYPTIAATVAEAPWNNNNWSTPENLAPPSGGASITAATFDAGDSSYVLKLRFGDALAPLIPVGSTIDGIRLYILARYAVNIVYLNLAQLLNEQGTRVGTNMYATPDPLTTYALSHPSGTATDTWGNALTRDWVTHTNFGVGIGVLAGGTGNTNNDVFITWVIMEVFYTPPPVGGSIRVETLPE